MPISFIDAQRLSMENREKEFGALVARIDSLIKNFCKSHMLDRFSKICVDITLEEYQNMDLMVYLRHTYEGWEISSAEYPGGVTAEYPGEVTLVFKQFHA